MNKLIIVAFVAILLSISLVELVNRRLISSQDAAVDFVEYEIIKNRQISNYNVPEIKSSDSYTIILAGDSMTDYLGENSDALREKLFEYYPEKIFGIFNYGFGSTNILSLQERLEKDTSYNGQNYTAILAREFDVIIIESYGHNPLSNHPLKEGLEKQRQALDKIVYEIVKEKPRSVIIFLATIAPSEQHYAEGVVELTDEQRAAWVAERKGYIENHIKYAKEHNIPLIDVYHKSLTDSGDVDITLINKDDYIHPSQKGIALIAREIANYLYQNKILPN